MCVSPGSDDTQISEGSTQYGARSYDRGQGGVLGVHREEEGDSKTDFHTVDGYLQPHSCLKRFICLSPPQTQ